MTEKELWRRSGKADALIDEMLDALRMAEPVLSEAVAAGVLALDDMSDRLALDAVQTAIAKAEGKA